MKAMFAQKCSDNSSIANIYPLHLTFNLHVK